MPLKNACFLSYRHRPDKDYRVFIEDLYDTLAGEISLYLGAQGVFRDTERLKGGDILEPSLGSELCGSACMVMIYIPPYFDEKETYCAREFLGMQMLETKRLKRLNGSSSSHGLIIPVICRGQDLFPGNNLFQNKVNGRRLFYNFEPYLLQKSRISKHKVASLQVKEIARYVFDRVNELNPIDPCQDCNGFSLPSPEDVLTWVRDVQAPKSLLPGRTS
jgi:hypothetical protein